MGQQTAPTASSASSPTSPRIPHAHILGSPTAVPCPALPCQLSPASSALTGAARAPLAVVVIEGAILEANNSIADDAQRAAVAACRGQAGRAECAGEWGRWGCIQAGG